MLVYLNNRSPAIYTADGRCLLAMAGAKGETTLSDAALATPAPCATVAVLPSPFTGDEGGQGNEAERPLQLSELLALAQFVLAQEQLEGDVELSISLVEAAEITDLNRRYRGLDQPTDVLSFESDAPLLGDVVICPEQVVAQLGQSDVKLAEQLRLLLVHGILHLLGYDHGGTASARAMEEREDALLNKWDELAGQPDGAERTAHSTASTFQKSRPKNAAEPE